MSKWGPWVDLKLTGDDLADEMATSPAAISFGRKPKDRYPYGTVISFTERELEKMQWDVREAKVGDPVDMRVMGKVTSVAEGCISVQLERVTCEDEAGESPPEPEGEKDEEEEDT